MEYTTTEWAGKKVIIGKGSLDPARPVKLLLGLHGADSTPENMLVYGGRLQVDNMVLAFPEGPVDAGEGLWSWWMDGPKQKESVTAYLEFSHALIEAAHQYMNETLPESEFETCLWGFSQGAAATLVYTLLGRHAIHRAASVCGFLPELPDLTGEIPTATRILGIYGANDDVVPSFLADFALEEMKGRGHDLTIEETQQGHEIHEDNLRKIAEFFGS